MVTGAPAVVPVALTIAGSDSGGGAGIQADLKTFGAFGVWGTSAVTAITAQNTLGVQDSLVLPAGLVRSQIDAVVTDLGVAAAKTGMLGTAGVIEAVADAVAFHHISLLVVDPVLVTSHGDLLLEPDGMAVLKELLLPRCALVTPNLPEAAALLGREVRDRRDMPAAAADLAALGPGAVLLKGGHLDGPSSPDLLWSDGQGQWLAGERVPGRHTHGTGCTLSAAICAQMARGVELGDACDEAKRFVTAAIRGGLDLGGGVGPVNPGWQTRR